ncbi:MAG: peroxidase family protein, partial [[Mycobacterium] stephanolepidis]
MAKKSGPATSATTLASWLATRIDRSVGWSRLPTAFGIAVLIGLRNALRADNLFDTGRAPGGSPPPENAACRSARTLDGTYNNLEHPLMGSVGSRFGRNAPLAQTFPESSEQLLDPNPRLISRRLLTRDEFIPATTLNVLAAAWIQFEVHDWFSHNTVETEPWTVPLDRNDPWPQRPMQIRRTAPDPCPDASGPPTFVTQDTHWWDGSQVYGGTRAIADALRTGTGGTLRLDGQGLPPADVEALASTSETAVN